MRCPSLVMGEANPYGGYTLTGIKRTVEVRNVTGEASESTEPEDTYEPPQLIPLGHVREVTLGSSSGGKADANSQYYWA
jgi:hypothetical protein